MGVKEKNKLTAADMILIAEQLNSNVTVYQYNGNYHIVHTTLEPRIHPFARVIHRTHADNSNKIMTYTERADYVREETINSKGEVLIRRYRRQSKGKSQKE